MSREWKEDVLQKLKARWGRQTVQLDSCHFEQDCNTVSLGDISTSFWYSIDISAAPVISLWGIFLERPAIDCSVSCRTTRVNYKCFHAQKYLTLEINMNSMLPHSSNSNLLGSFSALSSKRKQLNRCLIIQKCLLPRPIQNKRHRHMREIGIFLFDLFSLLY